MSQLSVPAAISGRNTAKTFTRLVSCSRTMMTVLDRAFGHPLEEMERAAHPLAGGLLQYGYQCGMLWGATLAAGAEAFRRYGAGPEAQAAAIGAANKLAQSFRYRAGSIRCGDITGENLKSPFGRLRYMLTGKALSCARLAAKWAPEAFKTVDEGLKAAPENPPEGPVSCSALLAERMGASQMEQTMVAGLAGGTGLGGDACGALGGAVWLTTLKWHKDNPKVGDGFLHSFRQESTGKVDSHREARQLVEKFLEASGSRWLCEEITGRRFENVNEHARFLRGGGCRAIIRSLAGEYPSTS